MASQRRTLAVGTGDISFKPAEPIQVETFAITTVVHNLGANGRGTDLADFNNDGNLDIVRAKYSGGEVHVYLGNGDGTFGPGLFVGDVGSDPYGVVAADFDNDGMVDIIANAGGNGAPHFFKGNGDGTFGARIQINTSNTTNNVLAVSAPPYHKAGTPYAVIRPDRQTIPLGGTANLDGSDSNDSDDGNLVSREWDFGDGSGSSDDSGIIKYEWDFGTFFEDTFDGTALDASKWIVSGVTQDEEATIVGAGSWSNCYLFRLWGPLYPHRRRRSRANKHGYNSSICCTQPAA